MNIKIQKVLQFDKDDKRVPMILDEWEWRWFSAGCIMESALKAMDAGEMSRADCERMILTTARVAHARAKGEQESLNDGEIVQSFISREEGRSYVLPTSKDDVTAVSDERSVNDAPTERARKKAAVLQKSAKELADRAEELATMLSCRANPKRSSR